MEEQELSLVEIWQVLKKRWKLVVVFPVIAALLSGIVSFFLLKPVYQASTTLIVGQKPSESSMRQAMELLEYNILLANKQLAKTYGTIAKSRTVEEKVIKDLNLPLTREQFDAKISVNNVKDTEVLEITVTDHDPQLAANIANAMAAEFTKAVIEIKKVDNVSIVDEAIAPNSPVKPNKKLNVLIAFAVGLMVSVGLAFLLEFLDNTIKNERDVEEVLGLPVLALIPDHNGDL
ncbi:MAG TPA: lipopolysaccharide biosynthesis protein [Peptococcaceae bacterium]|nr:lipopolysaccharide biosynthesis protein [Peptococcaceae bacterium]